VDLADRDPNFATPGVVIHHASIFVFGKSDHLSTHRDPKPGVRRLAIRELSCLPSALTRAASNSWRARSVRRLSRHARADDPRRGDVAPAGAGRFVHEPRRMPVSGGERMKPFEGLVATPLEDQVGQPCSCDACERDGQHAPACGVHEEPIEECDCPTVVAIALRS
jgi:hypothetical protein